jgi:hypothetical protein
LRGCRWAAGEGARAMHAARSLADTPI